MTTAIATIDPQTQAIAALTEAGDIAGLKDMAAMATGLKAAAKKRGLGIEQENRAAEVVIRAERAIGSLLLEIPRIPRDANLNGPSEEYDGILGIKAASEQAGINARYASLWQRLAKLTEEEFESMLAAKREASERIAKVDFYRAATRVDVVPYERVKAVQELLGEEAVAPSISAFETFRAAYEALDVTQIGIEELKELALIIQSLAQAYNAEKARR